MDKDLRWFYPKTLLVYVVMRVKPYGRLDIWSILTKQVNVSFFFAGGTWTFMITVKLNRQTDAACSVTTDTVIFRWCAFWKLCKSQLAKKLAWTQPIHWMLAPPAYPYERYSVLSPLASPELLRSVVTLLHESVETAVMNDWFSIFSPIQVHSNSSYTSTLFKCKFKVL